MAEKRRVDAACVDAFTVGDGVGETTSGRERIGQAEEEVFFFHFLHGDEGGTVENVADGVGEFCLFGGDLLGREFWFGRVSGIVYAVKEVFHVEGGDGELLGRGGGGLGWLWERGGVDGEWVVWLVDEAELIEVVGEGAGETGDLVAGFDGRHLIAGGFIMPENGDDVAGVGCICVLDEAGGAIKADSEAASGGRVVGGADDGGGGDGDEGGF